MLPPEVFATFFLRLARHRPSALGSGSGGGEGGGSGGGGGGGVTGARSRRNAGDKRCWGGCGRGRVALGQRGGIDGGGDGRSDDGDACAGVRGDGQA